MAAASPATDAGSLVAFEISIDGIALDPTIQVVSIEIWLGLDQPQTARLTFVDGDPMAGTFPVSESGAMAAGGALTISLGYDSALTRVFTGAIDRMGLEASAASGGRLALSATGDASSPPKTTSPILTLTWGESILDMDLSIGVQGPGRWSAPATSQGDVHIQGSALPTPGCTVTLAGLGARFDGDVPVWGVHHNLQDGQWVTRIDLGGGEP